MLYIENDHEDNIALLFIRLVGCRSIDYNRSSIKDLLRLKYSIDYHGLLLTYNFKNCVLSSLSFSKSSLMGVEACVAERLTPRTLDLEVRG